MKAKEIEALARKSMGVTPGVWTAQGGVLCCDGVPLFTPTSAVSEWQAGANADVLAALMNARAEAIYSLEQVPVLKSAVIGSSRQIASLRSGFTERQVGFIEAASQLEANRRALENAA